VPDVEQVALIPDERPMFSQTFLEVARLNLPEDGPAPSAKLRDSIKAVGIIQPILVTPTNGGYRVIDGRRRALAATQAGLDRVPVIVLMDAWNHSDSVLSVASHATRSDNPAMELRQIERMMASGASEGDIQRDTGMPAQTIRRRLRLCSLLPELREHFDRGRIGLGVAEAAAKLPAVLQTRLIETARERGRLTADDVREARMVRREEATRAAATLWDADEDLAESFNEPSDNEPAEFVPPAQADISAAAQSLLRDIQTATRSLERGDDPRQAAMLLSQAVAAFYAQAA